MRPDGPRLIDPTKAHERLAAREYGAKSPREIDEDARGQAEAARRPAAGRKRVTGGIADGTALLGLMTALEEEGLIVNEVDVDPGGHEPYENNQGLLFRGTAPSIVAGAAAGTSPTLSLTDATDNSGRIVLTVGTTPAAGLLATITFVVPKRNADYAVILSPRDSDAATAAGRSVYSDFGAATTTSFPVNCQTALAAGVSYHWDFAVIEREQL